MAETIPVPEVVRERTYVGRVAFPTNVPERLIEWLTFPDDVRTYARKMGLDDTAVKFLFALLGGKWGLGARVDLQQMAIKTGFAYSVMDEIIRELIKKNYARLEERLDLYRFWICLLHVKGVRFVKGDPDE